MRKKMLKALLVVPFIAGGVAFAMSGDTPKASVQAKDGYICPVTGETLPCPNCCPYEKK